MQTTLKPSFLSGAPFLAGQANPQMVAAWLFTALILLVGFRFAREAFSALLMRLYDLWIQHNAAQL